MSSVQKLAWNNEQIVLKNEAMTIVMHVHDQGLQGRAVVGEEIEDLFLIDDQDLDQVVAQQLKDKDDTIESLTNQVNNYDAEVKSLQGSLSALHDELAATKSSKDATISNLEAQLAKLTKAKKTSETV